MTTTSSTSASGKILGDAARRMLPVIGGRVLTAVTDRAVEKVDGLADRLGERSAAARGGGRTDTQDPADDEGGSPGRAGMAVAFLLEQARLFLAFVARLAAQALEMLRRATEKLRSRRAPEGIDEAPEPEEISAPEDLEDDGFEDEYEDEGDLESEDEDDRVEGRATVDA